MKNNRFLLIIIFIFMALTVSGCGAKLDDKKLVLSCSEIKATYAIGEKIEIDAKLLNNDKNIQITTGVSGPIAYSVYIDGKIQDLGNVESLAITREYKKGESISRTISISPEETGYYEIMIYANFSFRKTQYNICRQTISFTVV